MSRVLLTVPTTGWHTRRVRGVIIGAIYFDDPLFFGVGGGVPAFATQPD